MPSIPGFSICQKESDILTTDNKNSSNGNFLTQPYEHKIKQAAKSKCISRLETALAEAKSSGFMGHSKTWATAHETLLEWKSAESQLKKWNGKNDAIELTQAINKYEILKLVDEHEYCADAKKLATMLQAIDKLQQAIKSENIELIDASLTFSSDVSTHVSAQEHCVIFKDLVTSAEILLRNLKKESAYVADNPGYPKEEINKAIESSTIIDLKNSLSLWKRVGYKLQDPTFQNGIRVMQEVLESQQSKAFDGLQNSLNQRNLEELNKFLVKANEVELPPIVIGIYETMAVSTLETTYKIAEEMISCLFERNFEKLHFLVEKDNDVLHSVQNDDASLSMVDTKNKQRPYIEFLVENGILEAITTCDHIIDDVKALTSSIREECKMIFSLSQSISHGYESQRKQIETLDGVVSNFVSELQSISNQYTYSSGSYTYSESIKAKYFLENRPITVREFISIFVANSGTLTKAIDIARSSIQAFTNSFRLTLENITTFYRKEPEILSSASLLIPDYTMVHGAEAILDVINRYVDVTKSWKTLGLFAEPELVPRNSAEIVKSISYIEGAISKLCYSKSYDSPDAGFVDLCYNRPKESNVLLSVKCKDLDKIKMVFNSLQKIFPEKVILEDKKVAELRLVELRLRQADENAKLNSAKYDLTQAVNSKSESYLVRALQNQSLGKLYSDDPLLYQAEKELQKLRCDKKECIDFLKKSMTDKNLEKIESGLFRAEELSIPPTDSTVIGARRELEKLVFLQRRRMAALKELGEACNCIDVHKLRYALARARVCCISNLDPAYVKAMTMLKRIEAESEKNAVNHVRRINRRLLSDEKGSANPLRLIGEIQGNVEMIFNDIISESRYNKVCENLKTLEELQVPIPPDISEEATRALSLIHDRQQRLLNLTNQMQNALNNKCLEDLTAAIATAECSIEVLGLNVLAKVNVTYDLYATVKEVHALLELQQKREDEQSKQRHILSARRQLKKAILEKSCSHPLREAVEVFKKVCTPRKETKTEISIKFEKQVKASKSTSPESKLIRRSKSSIGPRHVTNKKRLLKQAGLTKSHPINYAEGGGYASNKQSKHSPKKRTASASRADNKNNIVPLHAAHKNAWEDIDKKNASLLRKAVKSLRRLEREEADKERESQDKKVWDGIRNDLREKLKQAMESGDRADMWEAIHEFTRCLGTDNLDDSDRQLLQDAHSAFNRITANQYQTNLEHAIVQRNADNLEYILYQIDNEGDENLPSNDDGKFKNEVKRAHKLLDHLKEFSKLKSSVSSMTRTMVSEIQSYPCPPDIVRKVMAATFLLLGEEPSTTQEWGSMACLMSKIGRFSLTRRVAICDPATISLQTAKEARSQIAGLSFDRVCLINKGASSFYSWAKCTIHEVMSRNGDGVEIHQPVTPKPKPPKSAKKESFVHRLSRPRTAQPTRRILTPEPPPIEHLTKIPAQIDDAETDEFFRRLARPKSAEPVFKLPSPKTPKVNTRSLVQRLARVKRSEFMDGDNVLWRKVNNFFP